MILLTNGDSWTGGDSPSQTVDWEVTPTSEYNIIPNFGSDTNMCDHKTTHKFYNSQIWPKVLGKKLGVETWNCGRLGASIDRIVDTTMYSIEYLHSLGKKDIFVVIGLTSLFRYSAIKQVKKKLTNVENHLLNQYIPNIENLEMLVKRHVYNIINLQNFLKMKKIQYLIFNCFDAELSSDFESYNLYQDIDLDNIYNRDFKPHFREYIEDKFNTNWGKNDEYFKSSHPTDKSHIAWAEVLEKYIRSNYEVF
jgi:hypothetical protein|tara:strand:- start:2537 stop:3289 length:753 start_codon:yes stop_codon:yes gene_type:complete